jgi:branched-chain amino acid transport system permease protein
MKPLNIFLVVLVLALALVPWVPQVVYPIFVMKLLCMALFACAPTACCWALAA